MDEIEKKQVLNESEDRKPAKKSEREVELPSGAKVKATKVQGWQSQKADKEADKERKKADESILVFKSSIAKELLKEFNLAEADPAAPAAPDANAVKQIQAMLKPGGQGVERLQNAIDPKTGIIYYGEEGGEGGMVSPKQTPYDWIAKGQQKEFQDLVKAAGLSIIPVDQKTMFGTTKVAAVDPKGLANLGKAPAAAPGGAQGAKTPAAGAAAGAAAGGAAGAAQGAKTPAAGAAAGAAPTGTQVQTDDEGNHMITTPDGKTMVVGPDGKPLPDGGKAAAPAAAPAAGATAKPPAGGAGGDAAVEATRKRMKELLDKLAKTGGVTGAPK